MKILMLSSYLPYPLFSGGHIRLYNLIKELSHKHEITLICEKRQNQTNDDIVELKKICKNVIVVDRQKQWSIKNIISSAFSLHSFLITGHTNLNMRNKIKEEIALPNFDLIHIETFYIYQNIPKTSLPLVLVEHNIEYLVYTRYMIQAPILLRPLLSLDIAKMRREEEYAWKLANKVVVVSEDDRKIVEQEILHPLIVPNGVNTDEFSYKKSPKITDDNIIRILYIGDFKWIQNRDALTWILKEIWPTVSKNFRSLNLKYRVKLWVVGRKIPNNLKNLSNDPDVIFDEENSKLPTSEIFQKASILLAPIRVGGGTSYKILEAMSTGTPVVTTPLSAEAIQAKDNYNIMVGSTASELAEKTIKLITDQNSYETICKNGRSLIENNYTWKEIAKKLDAVYLNIK